MSDSTLQVVYLALKFHRCACSTILVHGQLRYRAPLHGYGRAAGQHSVMADPSGPHTTYMAVFC